MNILIPDQWLREHLQTEAKNTEIQKYLSLCGPSVERIYHKDHPDGSHDDVYDIEVTTNRVDSMSVRGIAREAVTILNRSGFPSQLKTFSLAPIKQEPGFDLPLPEIRYETDAVKRVACVVLTNVDHTASPITMQNRLADVELNSHEAIIDITNYITHELGHPCHAFDYDKIMVRGGKIIIREAQPGESFVTLDGNAYHTVGGEVVFVDEHGEIIDLPAIKGTLNTCIDSNTRRVLFWVESLDAKKVRFASMSHAIRTVAAELNEKNVDPHLALDVLEYGVHLFKKLCHARIASSLYDYFPKRKQNPQVKISLARINTYLGIPLPSREIVAILKDLDFEVKETAHANPEQHLFAVTAPSFRQDISIPADVVEEIARIYGYHNLPSTLMTGAIPLNRPTDTDFDRENSVKNFLAALHWQEIYSYSLVSESLAEESGLALKEHLKLANPLKEENTYLRRSLLPSLREILSKNPQSNALSVFELAYTYQPQVNNLPDQQLRLALLSTKSYREVKGDVWALLEKLFVFAEPVRLEIDETNLSTKKYPLLQQKADFRAYKGRERLNLGQIWLYQSGLVGFELDWQVLLELAHRYPHYQKIAHTALVREDFTFTLDKGTAVGDFMTTLQTVDPRIKQLDLTNIYQANYSFTVIFQDPSVNMSSDSVEEIRKKLIQVANDQFHASLVGQVN